MSLSCFRDTCCFGIAGFVMWQSVTVGEVVQWVKIFTVGKYYVTIAIVGVPIKCSGPNPLF